MNLELYPKQHLALTTEANEILYGGSSGSGKVLALWTPILTTTGWKTMETLEIGDYVYGRDGKPTRVVAKSEVQYERTFRMTFGNYAEIVAGENHEWLTLTRNERTSNICRTPEFREKRRQQRAKRGTGKRPDLAERNAAAEHEYLKPIPFQKRKTLEIYETQRTETKKRQANHIVQSTPALQIPEKDLPIHPYVLGVWLGDGYMGSNFYTSADPEIGQRIASFGYTITDRKDGEKNCRIYAIKDLLPTLKEIGVYRAKHIPEIYKQASYEQRLELVRGLLDTDGHVAEQGKVEISLSHPILGNDFVEVLRSLGIRCNIRQREAYLYGVRKKDRFRMNFTTEVPVFTLPRHVKRLEDAAQRKQKKDLDYWYITNVEEIEQEPLQCIQVDNESHTYLVGEHLIPTHNSFLIRHALILYAMYIPNLTCYLFRRKYNELRANHLFGPEGYISVLDPFIKAGKCKINLSDNRIDFFHEEGTSRIFLGHMQHAKDMYIYQGEEIHVAAFDEVTHFTSDMYKYIRTRVRVGSLKIDYEKVRQYLPFIHDGYFPRIISGTNPGGIGAAFIKKAFIDPIEPMTTWQTPPEQGGMKRIFIPAYLTDNKKLLEQDPTYRDKLIGAGGTWAKQLLEGDWSICDGGAFDDLWDQETHVIPQLIVPEDAYVLRALDWGTFHPSVALHMLIASGETYTNVRGEKFTPAKGSVIVIHEIYNCDEDDANEGNRKSAVEVGMQLAEYESQVPWRDNIRNGPADTQIFQKRGGISETISDLIVAGYNQKMNQLRLADSSYTWGYDKDYLFEEADQSPGSRVSGLALVRDYMRAAVEQENDNPGLYFVETCRRCIETIPTLPRSETNPEDTDQSGSVPDHAYDPLRYTILSRQDSMQVLKMTGL